MRKTAIKLTILSIILLVSISGIVLGAENNATKISNGTGAEAMNSATNVAVAPTVTNTTNVITTDTTVNETPVNTQKKVIDTSVPIYPQDTGTPQKPVQTPKSPGFGSVVSIAVLLLAMYINKRK